MPSARLPDDPDPADAGRRRSRHGGRWRTAALRAGPACGAGAGRCGIRRRRRRARRGRVRISRGARGRCASHQPGTVLASEAFGRRRCDAAAAAPRPAAASRFFNSGQPLAVLACQSRLRRGLQTRRPGIDGTASGRQPSSARRWDAAERFLGNDHRIVAIGARNGVRRHAHGDDEHRNEPADAGVVGFGHDHPLIGVTSATPPAGVPSMNICTIRADGFRLFSPIRPLHERAYTNADLETTTRQWSPR